MSPSCLITFEKIETFICQSQKQTFAFKLENLCLSDIFRSKGEKQVDVKKHFFIKMIRFKTK